MTVLWDLWLWTIRMVGQADYSCVWPSFLQRFEVWKPRFRIPSTHARTFVRWTTHDEWRRRADDASFFHHRVLCSVVASKLTTPPVATKLVIMAKFATLLLSLLVSALVAFQGTQAFAPPSVAFGEYGWQMGWCWVSQSFKFGKRMNGRLPPANSLLALRGSILSRCLFSGILTPVCGWTIFWVFSSDPCWFQSWTDVLTSFPSSLFSDTWHDTTNINSPPLHWIECQD